MPKVRRLPVPVKMKKVKKIHFTETISAVEQWYIMVGAPKHQIRSLSSCGRYSGMSLTVFAHRHRPHAAFPQQSR